jgi:hypothetical protein
MAQLTGPILLTTAGQSALLSGTFAPTELALGSSSWTPTVTDDALQNERARVPMGASVEQVGEDAILHITAIDDGDAAYAMRELALYDADGECLAIYAQATDIATKSTGSQLLISLDATVLNGSVDSITVGDTTYLLPAASETSSGLVERATTAEVIAGSDAVRYVSPAGLAALLATTTRKGLARFATTAEVIAGAITDAIVTPATLVARAASATLAGLVELATSAEVQAGTDTTRAVTPAGLAARSATDTRTGLVELATPAEVQAGTDTTRAVTPATHEAAEAQQRGTYSSGDASGATLAAAGGSRTLATWSGLRPGARYAVTVHVVITRPTSIYNLGLDIQLNSAVSGEIPIPSGEESNQSLSWTVTGNATSSGALSVRLVNNMGVVSVDLFEWAAACFRVR